MNPQINIHAFEGEAFNIQKHNIRKDTVFAFPKGSFIIASDIVMDGDTSVAEIWLAVPFTASVADEYPVRQATIPPGEEAWEVEDENEPFIHEDDEITVDLLDGDEDSEDVD